MLFLLHILLLLHGAFGLVVAKLRQAPLYELLPDRFLLLFEKLWPENVYRVWKRGVPDFEAEPAQAYALAGGSVAYAVWYLHRNQR